MIGSTVGSTRIALHGLHGLILGIATFAIVGSSSVAQAQYQAPPPGYYAPPPRYSYGYPPPPRVYRSGLVLGVGIGFGGMSASDCGDACGAGLAYDFHIGGMLAPQVALLFDISGVAHSVANSSVDIYNTMYVGALQFWPTNALWLRGGFGLAHYTETDVFTGDYGDDTGEAILAAAGYEVYQAGPFTIDLQLHFAEAFYSVAKNHSNVAFIVGFNWY
jgi:hypothetical protein